MKWEVSQVVLSLSANNDDFMAVHIAENHLDVEGLWKLPKGMADSVRKVEYDCHFGSGFAITFDGTPSELDKVKTQKFIERHIKNCRKEVVKRQAELSESTLRTAREYDLL